MKKFILSLALLSASFSVFAKWELNDVSYLFILPKAAEGKDFLIKPDRIFPRPASGQVDDLIQGVYADPRDSYPLLRVVGMRIDPCFNFKPLPQVGPCHSQIRLVWQPILNEGTDSVSTYDAAVHTFHALSQKEFTVLTQKLLDLKNQFAKRGISTMGRPLNVHPGFLNPHTRSAFNSVLKSIILSSAKAEDLVRFTFMKRLTPEIWWQFGGEDKQSDGRFLPINIARVGEGVTRQDFFNDDFHEQVGMKGTIMPAPLTKTDSPEDIVTGWGIRPSELETLKKGIHSLNRIDNPRIHNPESMDCVSCHIPDSARTWLEVKHPAVLKKANHSQEKYVQKFAFFGHQLRNETLSRKYNKSIRAFGYKDARPSINQRVINESAEVADLMSSF